MESKSSARFTAFCIILLLIWYVLDSPLDLNWSWSGDWDSFDIFSGQGMTFTGVAIAIAAIVFAMVMAGLVIAGVSFLLVGIAVLVGGLLLMIFAPLLLPIVVVLILFGVIKRALR